MHESSGTALWHPFANMAHVAGNELVIESGDGVWLTDANGKRYLDGTASLWYCNVGHGRQEIADAVSAQMRRLEAYNIFGSFSNRPAQELAARLSALAPFSGAKAFFTSGGGDAIESAVKIARQFHTRRGEPGRVHVISRVGSYHGTNGIGTALAGIEINRTGFGEYMAESSLVGTFDLDGLRAQIEATGPERVAAFVFEPITGTGGVGIAPDGYLEGAVELCRSYGILTIADSVICGFGRLGTWFGVERWGLSPDMITFAKGVTSGYQPLGGVMVSAQVAEPFWDGDGFVLRQGSTYSGHPVVCAAGLANLDIIESETLLDQSKSMETVLANAVKPLADLEAVREVRAGTGLMAGVEIAPAVLEADPDAAMKIQNAARDRGVIVRAMGVTIAVSPPLIVTSEEITTIVAALEESIREVTRC